MADSVDQPFVSLRRVTKRFGRAEVLSAVDLDVARGQVMCVIGPSGSGKSTMLRCINRLEKPTSGVVVVGGEVMGYRVRRGRLHELPASAQAVQRRRVGMVFQGFNLFPHLTALQNIMVAPLTFSSDSKAVIRADAEAAIARVGLSDKHDAYPAELSGGQKQRIAIARALMTRPEIVLFDEPTSALDPEMVGEVLNVMRDLASSGITMIVVTHELGFARGVADELVFMDQGAIVERGRARAVLDNPVHDRTKNFLASVLQTTERQEGDRSS